jgi:hypothetical protein
MAELTDVRELVRFAVSDVIADPDIEIRPTHRVHGHAASAIVQARKP